jgi:hypothetical protein
MGAASQAPTSMMIADSNCISKQNSHLKGHFGNQNILTERLACDLIDLSPWQQFRFLPRGAYPAVGGVLVGAVPGAGIGGSNVLINPIDNQPILFDVSGN